jgi:hypothetical protein
MLNSGKKFRALRDKKNNILILVLFEKKILNEIKNHNPPLLQVKWSVPYKNKNKQNKEMILLLYRRILSQRRKAQ